MIYYMDSLPGGHPNIDVVRRKFMKWVLILLIYNWHKYDYWVLLLIWSWFNFDSAMCICRSLHPKSKSKSSIIPWIEIKVYFLINGIFFDNVINGIFNSSCGLNFNYVIFFQCPMQTNGIDCGYFVMRFMKEIILANQDIIPENVCMWFLIYC